MNGGADSAQWSGDERDEQRCAGQAVAAVNPLGERTTTVYDAAGREIRTVNPLGNIVTSGYDAAGQKTLRIDARGNRTTYTFDDAGRNASRVYPDDSRITWTYDAAGNPTSVAQPDGDWTRSFDPINRVVAVAQPNGGTLTFSYDAAGRRDFMLDTAAGRTTYSYDDAGRITSLVNPDGDITTYSYDAAGRRTVKVLANQTRASYTYDDASRVTLLGNLKSTGEVISSFEYAYDAAGNRTRVVEADGDRVTWTYDATYQLLAEQRDGLDAYAHTFTYDAVGNRLTKTEDGDTTTYSYDVGNRLRFSQPPAAGRTTYVYDADGNQRSIEDPTGDLTTNTWDYENQNTQVELPTGEIYTFVYNSELLRVAREDDLGVTTEYVWDADNILTETDDAGDPQAEYTYEPQAYGNLISQHDPSALESSYYHYDALGSTNSLTDSSEVITDTYLYRAFGHVEAQTGTTTNPYQWVGEVGYYFDPDIGRYQLRRRWYDPATARFVSEDPIRDQEENLYRYIENNPVSLIDPTGEEVLELIHETNVDAAKKIVAGQPTIGQTGYFYLRDAQHPSGVKGADRAVQFHLRVEVDKIKDIPDEVMAKIQRAANKHPSMKGLSGDAWREQFGRVYGQLIRDWMDAQPDDVFRYKNWRSKPGYHYAFRGAGLGRTALRLLRVTGSGAKHVIPALADRIRAELFRGPKKGKIPIRGSGIRTVGRGALRVIAIFGIAVDAYEVWTAENRPKELTKKAGAWGTAGFCAWGWAKGGAAAGAFFGGPIGGTIGGIIGGIGGGFAGYWAGGEIVEVIWEYFEEPGVEFQIAVLKEESAEPAPGAPDPALPPADTPVPGGGSIPSPTPRPLAPISPWPRPTPMPPGPPRRNIPRY